MVLTIPLANFGTYQIPVSLFVKDPYLGIYG